MNHTQLLGGCQESELKSAGFQNKPGAEMAVLSAPMGSSQERLVLGESQSPAMGCKAIQSNPPSQTVLQKAAVGRTHVLSKSSF